MEDVGSGLLGSKVTPLGLNNEILAVMMMDHLLLEVQLTKVDGGLEVLFNRSGDMSYIRVRVLGI